MAGALHEYQRMFARFSRNTRWYLVYTAMASTNTSIFILVFNLYLHARGYNAGFIGLLNAIPSVVILLVGLPAGVLASRFGYKRFLVAGASLTLLSTLLLLTAQGQVVYVLVALMRGAAGSLSWVIGIPMLVDNSDDEERVYAISTNFAIMTLTGVVGSLLGGLVPEVASGLLHQPANASATLRWAFVAQAGFNAAAIIPLLMLRDRVRLAGAAPVRLRQAIAPKLFIKLLLPTAIIGLGAGAMINFFQLYFALRFRLSPGAIGTIFAISSFVTAAATMASPTLVRRFGTVRTVFYTELASLPFLLALAWTGNLPAAALSYYARGALMNMGGPVAITFGMERLKPEQRGAFSSLDAMVGGLGRGGMGPLISGVLQEHSGFSLAFTFTFVCYVVASFLWFALWSSAERKQADGSWRATVAAPSAGVGT